MGCEIFSSYILLFTYLYISFVYRVDDFTHNRNNKFSFASSRVL